MNEEKIKETNEELKAILLRHCQPNKVYSSPIMNLNMVRRESVYSSGNCFEKPLASLVVHGNKQITVGGCKFDTHAGQCLVSGVDCASVSSLVDVSPENPFLCIFFYLDKQVLADLLIQMHPEDIYETCEHKSVSVANVELEFIETLLRLVKLLDKPEQIGIRAPIIMRELHYLLLIGPHGRSLQQLYRRGSSHNQIVHAISIMKQNIASPLPMEELADQISMSISSMYRHFKNVTGFSPLQYYKQLRLHEAQRLMFSENERAAIAALTVGYESVAQFNREYKRMFGDSPHRDINKRKCLS